MPISKQINLSRPGCWARRTLLFSLNNAGISTWTIARIRVAGATTRLRPRKKSHLEKPGLEVFPGFSEKNAPSLGGGGAASTELPHIRQVEMPSGMCSEQRLQKEGMLPPGRF